MTHAFCMQGSLRFHHWLLDVVPTAVGRLSRNNWLDRLATDVELAFDRKKSATFSSADYLPNLPFHREYSTKVPSFRYVQKELIISTVSSILRHWLHFPSDGVSLVQLSLIDIILSSKSPTLILFLDKIWEMYETPFSTIFNSWNARTSKAKIEASLSAFRDKFTSHAFATPGSSAYQKLEYLSQLITQWIENNEADSTAESMVSKAAYTFLDSFLDYFIIILDSSYRIQPLQRYKLTVKLRILWVNYYPYQNHFLKDFCRLYILVVAARKYNSQVLATSSSYFIAVFPSTSQRKNHTQGGVRPRFLSAIPSACTLSQERSTPNIFGHWPIHNKRWHWLFQCACISC